MTNRLKELTGLKELSLFNNPIEDKDTVEVAEKIRLSPVSSPGR